MSDITVEQVRELYEQDKRDRQRAFTEELQALVKKYNVVVDAEITAQGNTAIARLVIKAL